MYQESIKQTIYVPQILENVWVVLCLSFCCYFIATSYIHVLVRKYYMIQNQVCIAVLFGSFYIDLFYPSLEILFYNFAGALSVVQYTCIVLQNCKTKIKTDKKKLVGILRCIKYGSLANVWCLLSGTSLWKLTFELNLKNFLTFSDNLLFYTISLYRQNGYGPRPLLCIYCIYMLCLTLITAALDVIYLQNLLHLHKSCTNMDIKNIYTLYIIGSYIHEDFLRLQKKILPPKKR